MRLVFLVNGGGGPFGSLLWIVLSLATTLTNRKNSVCHGWTVRRRHSRLLPWKIQPPETKLQQHDGAPPPPPTATTAGPRDHHHHHDICLGWTLEEQQRNPPWSKTHACRVTVGNSHNNKNNNDNNNNNNQTTTTAVVQFQLPIVPHDESLATSVWSAGLAAAILCQQPTMVQLWRTTNGGNCTVLELGSGLGVTGLTAAQHAAHVQLTDQDATVITAMQDPESNMPPNVRADRLDWRDIHNDNNNNDNNPATPVDVVLGSDIAYYYYLLRPLMDTARAFLKPSGSLLFVVGQANRASLWELYRNVKDGCYNQLSDEREPPWPGTIEMRLFRLQVEDWVVVEQLDDTDQNNNGVVEPRPTTTTATTPATAIDYEDVPIAVMLYQSPGFVAMTQLTEYDYVATPADFAAMEMSF
jgi:predicted nicotinamide N-methyase